MFGRGWEPATAAIVMARVRGVGGSTGMKSILEFVADVRPPGGGTAFRAELSQPHDRGFLPPGEGMEVKVLADVRHETAKFDMSDPARTRARPPTKQKEAWKAGLDAEPGTQIAGGAAQAAPTDAELLAAWRRQDAHRSHLADIESRNDPSQMEAWSIVNGHLGSEMLRLSALRPDWKSPAALARES